MEFLRARLISQIDHLLSQLASEDIAPQTQLQIEANLISPQSIGNTNRRIVLDSINIDEFKQLNYQHGDNVRVPDANANPDVSMALPPFSSLTSGPTVPPYGFLERIEPSILAQPAAGHLQHLTQAFASPTGSSPSLDNSNGVTPPITPTTDRAAQNGYGSVAVSHLRKMSKDSLSKADSSAVDRLIEGIWRQLHDPKTLDLGVDIDTILRGLIDPLSGLLDGDAITKNTFSDATKRCLQITNSSRSIRCLEVLIQAHWSELFDARLAAIREEYPKMKQQEQKKIVMTEACNAFGWAEKELRNRMAVWKGYREIKESAGWLALIFAGPGIYRYCKYRSGFDAAATQKLRAMRLRAEVAADTLQPQWRQLLACVEQPTEVRWVGHPHDWTVSLLDGIEPLHLPVTYHQWDVNFSYKQIEESIIDEDKWHGVDPRRCDNGPEFYCKSCTLRQSQDVELNSCECYPDLYSPKPRTFCPVQIFRTPNGRNNGLIACCAFEVGHAVGEFVGMITSGLANMDVMQSQAGEHEPYQIWQGRCGNFTRFINHSCASNCSFETFSWLGIQRIVVVSKGVQAGEEITVDYSDRYWDNLDKICLCGAPTCRYKDRMRIDQVS